MPTPRPPATTDPSAEMSVFWYRFRREILIGFLILLLAAVGWGVFRFYSSQRENDAAAHLAAANSAEDFRNVISQFGSTRAGGSAYLMLAGKQRSAGRFAESYKTLQDFIDKNSKNELVPSAKMTMAANLESLKKTDEALSLYQQIAATYPRSFTAPWALISEVPLLKEKNQADIARRACETVLSQYGESFWTSEAMRELRTLKPAAAPSAPSAPPSLSPAATVKPSPSK